MFIGRLSDCFCKYSILLKWKRQAEKLYLTAATVKDRLFCPSDILPVCRWKSLSNKRAVERVADKNLLP